MIKNFPSSISYSLNRVSDYDRRRLDLTCDHFNINEHKQRNLLSEVILRLGYHINSVTSCQLPVDERGRALYRMYKYFDSLDSIEYVNN